MRGSVITFLTACKMFEDILEHPDSSKDDKSIIQSESWKTSKPMFGRDMLVKCHKQSLTVRDLDALGLNQLIAITLQDGSTLLQFGRGGVKFVGQDHLIISVCPRNITNGSPGELGESFPPVLYLPDAEEIDRLNSKAMKALDV